MIIDLNYGIKGYPLQLPDDWDVTLIRKRAMPLPDDADLLLESAFDKPESSNSLTALASGKTSACILICDVTRPVPNGRILPPLIRRLLDAGMAPENITILVATGLHRPNEGEELRRLVGDDWVLDKVKVENHFARDETAHADLGYSSNAVPILIDRRFVEADLRIVTGLVEPHFMAGYSGGRKLIVPGVAAEASIRRIHASSVLSDEAASNCTLEGNPLHKLQMEMVEQLTPVYAVNVVLDEDRNICLANFGDLEESHLAAVEYLKQYAEIPVDKRFNTVITSAAGAPLDASYYQTVKAMVAATGALRPGGSMFVASACNDGLGSAEYRRAQERLIELGEAGFLKHIAARELAEIDEWQTQMQVRATSLGAVHLYTDGLNKADAALTGVNIVTNLEEAIGRWVEACGDKRVAVIPEGPYVIPRSVKA